MIITWLRDDPKYAKSIMGTTPLWVFTMSWFLLILAGLFEIGWAVGLKYTEGFTRLWPSIFTVASMTVSVLLLGLAVKQLPIGTAYGVWVGIGAMGTAIAGIVLLGEGVSLLKIASLVLILLGVLGLKLAH